MGNKTPKTVDCLHPQDSQSMKFYHYSLWEHFHLNESEFSATIIVADNNNYNT